MQEMADLYRIKSDLLKGLIKSTTGTTVMIKKPPAPSLYITIIDDYLVSFRTEAFPSSITAIPFFNIFLFASISCLFGVDITPLKFTRPGQS